MKDRLQTYLDGERRSGVYHLLAGLVTVAVATAAFLLWPVDLLRGLAGGMLSMALPLFWSGAARLGQSARLRRQLPALLDDDPGRFRDEELRRCAALDHKHRLHQRIVLAFTMLGLLLALLGGVVDRNPLVMGMGFGLCLPGAVLLVLDLADQWRDDLYRHAVERRA